MSRWCYLNVSSSATHFFCLQSFPESRLFPKRQLCPSGGQSIGVSASAPVLPISIQGWFPFWFDLLDVQGTLKSLFQHHSLKALIFSSQPSLWSNSHICTWLLKIYSFDHTDLCWQSDLFAFFFTTLSSFVIAFLPKSIHLLISRLQSPSIVMVQLALYQTDSNSQSKALNLDNASPDMML